jgi:hypothetical protein
MKTTSNLITGLENIPSDWQLTPLGKIDRDGKANPKAPYTPDWNITDTDRAFIIAEIEVGKAVGYGLRLGQPSGYIVAIDFDGQSAIDMMLEKLGELQKTVTFASGKPGRYQALFTVPEQYREVVTNKKQKTGVNGEQIEFRYNGNQSVLPPSAHPETDGYKWINNPIDTPIAELPQAAIDYWLSLTAPKVNKSVSRKSKQNSTSTTAPIPLENCLAKSNRQLLDGETKPGRSDAGTKLSRDLIGAANYLDSIGVVYDGDPRVIFDRFVDNCSPPIDPSEAD